MITRTLSLLALATLPLLAAAQNPVGRTATPAKPVAHRDHACEAVLRDTKHPRFAECLAAAYKVQMAKPLP